MKTLVIIPAWNEEENILNTVRDLRENGEGLDFLVVNDCSTDSTASILRENGIPFLDLPVNLGIGGGVQAGYRYALERGYDIAVQFDGDGQHMGVFLSALLEPIQAGRADYAIGSRFLEGEGFQSSLLRRLGIRFLSGLIRSLCGVLVLDATSGMRAVNRDLIALFAADYPQDYPEPEAILAAGLRGFRVEEVPVRMRERQGGVSSINPLRSVYYMIKVSLALVLSRAMYGRRTGKRSGKQLADGNSPASKNPAASENSPAYKNSAASENGPASNNSAASEHGPASKNPAASEHGPADRKEGRQ